MTLVSAGDTEPRLYAGILPDRPHPSRRDQPAPHQEALRPSTRRIRPVLPEASAAARDEATGRLTAAVSGDLHPTALRIYQTLHQIALEVASRRGYAASVSTVTYHLPTELLAFELGMSRTTLWTHVKILRAQGLVDQRGHTTTHKGQRVKDGSLWSIKLRPNRGKRARLSYDDLKHAWRDLSADIQRGRTVYNWVEQSNTVKEQPRGVSVLLTWALSPGSLKPPSELTVQPASGPEVLLDVAYAPRGTRNSMVDAAARSIAAFLGDPSTDFYRFLTWQLLRRYDQGQDYFHAIYTVVLRAGADRREGFARRPGALVVKRLRDAGLWDWLRDAPLTRVGEPPGR